MTLEATEGMAPMDPDTVLVIGVVQDALRVDYFIGIQFPGEAVHPFDTDEVEQIVAQLKKTRGEVLALRSNRDKDTA